MTVSQPTVQRMVELLEWLDEQKHNGVIYLDALYGNPHEVDCDDWTIRDEISKLVDDTVTP